MAEEKIVSTDELEKIKKCVENAMKNSISLSSLKRIPIRMEEMLDEKDKAIFDHIRNNEGIIQDDVVKAFIKNLGYSRKPVLKRIKRLEKYGFIVVRPDRANSNTHHLFTNKENELVSLVVDLDSFKQAYFQLVDRLNLFLNDNHVIFAGFKGLMENLKLVNAILTPFKLMLSLCVTFDIFIPFDNILDSESLHRRFAFIYSTIKDLRVRLDESFFKEPRIKLDDGFFVNTYQHDNLNFSNNVLHDILWGSNLQNIESMMVTLDKYRLRECASTLLDRMWKIIYPIFPRVYTRYSKENPDIFKDWKKVVEHFRDFDTGTQVLGYRKSVTEFTEA